MTTIEYDLLKMRHARAVANMNQFAVIAYREATLGGWKSNWEDYMREANDEALMYETQIANLIDEIDLPIQTVIRAKIETKHKEMELLKETDYEAWLKIKNDI